MQVYRVSIKIEDKSFENIMKDGVMASTEFGRLNGDEEIPAYKVNVLVKNENDISTTWAQILKYDSSKGYILFEEGFIHHEEKILKSNMSDNFIEASVHIEEMKDSNIIKCLSEVSFSKRKCCTSYGDNCYVKCCNCCCSDAVACPGASCCAM
ncbi:hypothetical protein [Sulfurimonas sp.]|uniref:hypothetical protein n=1 Tax=Sulfurimonas sp. TaxID=2022749 RepID=UPI003D10A286